MSRRILWLAAALAALVACEKAQEETVVSHQLVSAEDPQPWIIGNMFDRIQPADGAPVTLTADHGGTRAHIEMNEEGDFARSVWKSGDAFNMFAMDAQTGRAQLATFTTGESGASAEFSSPNGFSIDPPYYALFPNSNRVATYNGSLLVSVNIPAEQVAVPGGIQDGYTVAYSATPSRDEFIHFQNIVSLVRFRMSGAVASQVKSVTIKGKSRLAGDVVVQIFQDGSVDYNQRISLSGDTPSSVVTLSGDFVAGQDYFLVLEPGEQSAFEMIFADDANHYTAKSAFNYTFPRGRIVDFGTIDLGSEFEEETIDYEPIRYMTASAGAPKPVSIAVVGDGFTADEQDQFVSRAMSAVDALMNTEPYKTYRNYFNVWILRAASKESGASITDGSHNVTTFVNSYFGSRWGADSYGDMDLDDVILYDFLAQKCPDVVNGTHPIEEVPVLVLINDTRYGGICQSYSNGQGYGMVPWTYEGGPIHWSYPNLTPSTDDPIDESEAGSSYHWTTEEEYAEMGKNSGDWRNTVVHEFGGHCFGRLGDEYWKNNQVSYDNGSISGHSWQVPFSLNLASDPTAVPWAAEVLNYPLEDLIAKDPNYSRIGIFQGGDVKLFGRWRSEMISCMIDNRFYFSTWQRMLIVKRIMDLSGSEFNAASFWANDKTQDPVRDVQSSPVIRGKGIRAREVPLLPPPVLHEVRQ